MSADLVIRGGTVVDGTGAPGHRADVAVTDGRISAIGPGLDGERVLDAGDHVVAPGFIDIHTHYDAQVFWDPALTPSCFHGVTTVLAGNCGFSLAPTRVEHQTLVAQTLEQVEDMDVAALAAGVPWDFSTFPEYLGSVGRRGTALNFAAYCGHTALRLFVMGDDAYDRAATPDEVVGMQRVLREAMEAGATGFASSFTPTHRGAGGKPVPSRLAERDEPEALLDTMRDVGYGLVAFTLGSAFSVDELYEMQPRLGVPITYTALLTNPAGTHKLQVESNHAGWQRGGQVWPQVSPRPLVFSLSAAAPFNLNPNPAFGDLVGLSLDERRRAYADEAWRARARVGWDENPRLLPPRWDTYEISESTAHPDHVGRRLVDIAAERGVSPLDALLDAAVDEPGLALRFELVLANDDEAGVAELLNEEHCTLGLSDAGAHVGQLCDAPQATDLLGNWVRDRGVMTVEAAVRKLTSVQAGLMGLPDRGELRPGAWADVTVFDPATVAPGPTRRVRDFPADSERLTADSPTGVRHVVVNGTPIVDDGVHRPEARPGRVVGPALARRPA